MSITFPPPTEAIKQVIVDSTIKIDVVLSPCHCTLNDISIKDYAKFFEVRAADCLVDNVIKLLP